MKGTFKHLVNVRVTLVHFNVKTTIIICKHNEITHAQILFSDKFPPAPKNNKILVEPLDLHKILATSGPADWHGDLRLEPRLGFSQA